MTHTEMISLLFFVGLAFAAPGGYGPSANSASSFSSASASSGAISGNGQIGSGTGSGGLGYTGGGGIGHGGYDGAGGVGAHVGQNGYANGASQMTDAGSVKSASVNSGSSGASASSGISTDNGPNFNAKHETYGAGTQKGSYTPEASSNSIPTGGGNAGSGYRGSPSTSLKSAATFPGAGSGYAGGFTGSYSGGSESAPVGGPTSDFPYNLPQGCFSGFQNFGADPYQIHQQIMNNIQRIHEENLRFGTGFGGAPNGAHPENAVSAFASGSIGPGGGYGSAGVAPKDPGSIAVRFGDATPDGASVHTVSGNLPPPSGNSYSISTSSQSGSSTLNGQTKSYKSSEVSVNDNGKVTTYRAHSP